MTDRSRQILRESLPSIIAAIAISGVFGSLGVYVNSRLMAAEIQHIREDLKETKNLTVVNTNRIEQVRGEAVAAERVTTAKLETINATISNVAKDVAYLRGKAEREQRP